MRKNRKLAMKVPGFTLIEMMIVIALIAIVTAAIGTFVYNSFGRAQDSTARQQAIEIAKQVELFKLQYGRYPSQSEGLQVLVAPPSGRPFMDKLPVDPWGNEYIYIYPGVMNKNKPDIRSKGDDGIENTQDDVGNW